MQPEKIIESMHEQVRTIHRALTGEDVNELDREPTDEDQTRELIATDEIITRRFADLDQAARSLPAIASRVPPFSFVPPVDVVAGPDAVVLELAVAGVDREDIAVHVQPGALVISGIRRDDHAETGQRFHAEIPRGPFSRVIPLPAPVEGEPQIALERGLLQIHLRLVTTNGHDTSEPNDVGNQDRHTDKETR